MVVFSRLPTLQSNKVLGNTLDRVPHRFVQPWQRAGQSPSYRLIGSRTTRSCGTQTTRKMAHDAVRELQRGQNRPLLDKRLLQGGSAQPAKVCADENTETGLAGFAMAGFASTPKPQLDLLRKRARSQTCCLVRHVPSTVRQACTFGYGANNGDVRPCVRLVAGLGVRSAALGSASRGSPCVCSVGSRLLGPTVRS